MNWWIGGSLCGLTLVALVLLLVVVSRRQVREKAELVARIEREGQLVLGWIVMANPILYKESNSDHWSYAQIVFTPQGDIPNLNETLRQWAQRLHSYRPPPNPTEDERIIRSVMKSEIPYCWTLRLPDEITGGLEGYTCSIEVPWSKLPRRKLELPYLYCKVLLGDVKQGIVVPYPEST